MLRRFAPLAAVLAVALLLAACTQPLVDDEVTITIEKNDRALITAQTTFNDTDVKSDTRLRIVQAAQESHQGPQFGRGDPG